MIANKLAQRPAAPEIPASPTRRAALTAAASGLAARAAPIALAGPAPAAGGLRAASAHDPIFAVIEAHRAAWGRFEEATGGVDSVATAQAGRVVGDDDEARYAESSQAEQDALDAFLSTPPTSLAGLRAALDYAASFKGGEFDEFAPAFLRTLAGSPALTGEGQPKSDAPATCSAIENAFVEYKRLESVYRSALAGEEERRNNLSGPTDAEPARVAAEDAFFDFGRAMFDLAPASLRDVAILSVYAREWDFPERELIDRLADMIEPKADAGRSPAEV